jgi:hypothetical protein
MDISFHYYAVKSTALAAGYTEPQAQRIAAFSQFVDDYNWYTYFLAGNIPPYVKSTDLDIVFNETLGIINPVTTGFSDWFDMATLILPRSQKFTVAPFHFIPKDPAHVSSGDYRTVPATLNDSSYISGELALLGQDIHQGVMSDSDSLMKMGMLFHTFADTYAHQLYTGYNNTTNSVELVQVTDNITGKDETEQYRSYVEIWVRIIEKQIGMPLPTIGHMIIAHIPDLSHISFTIKYPGLDGTEHTYTRSNTSTFITTCQELYRFMRTCLPEGTPADMEWDDLYPKLADGLLCDVAQDFEKGEDVVVKKLSAHWSSVFPQYQYSYNSQAIKRGFIVSTSDEVQSVVINNQEQQLFKNLYSDDFYKFNYFADKHLIVLYGSHPRNFLSEQNGTV